VNDERDAKAAQAKTDPADMGRSAEGGPDAAAFGGAVCPIPISDYPNVQLAHGGGGRLSQMLVEGMFLEAFRNPALEPLHDGAVLEADGSRLAFSTDSFVVRPLFFPGGDIGSLAVHGTVNDVAMCGAKPIAISAGLILEEGFPMEDLWRITQSLRDAAAEAGVPVVTGDTKVVDRGKGDGVYINTTGLGLVYDGIDISPSRVQPGDRVLLSGALAEHGIAIMSVREGLEFETTLETDSAALHGMVAALVEAAGPDLHVLRDPTRGGLASALNEIAQGAGVRVHLDERAIPLREQVRGACEILGFDPLYVANEGKCIAIVAPDAADAALEAMRAHPKGAEAAIIGEVAAGPRGQVVLRSRIGGERIVDMMSGEQLPRIC
jgi:hydrogenase expression/formation protein HypE